MCTKKAFPAIQKYFPEAEPVGVPDTFSVFLRGVPLWVEDNDEAAVVREMNMVVRLPRVA